MRSLGYMLAKWVILRDVGVGLQTLTPVPKLGFSYATEAHGLWTLKAYAPVMATTMTRTRFKGQDKQYSAIEFEAKDSVLRYALAHQQLEAVIQLEYSVNFHDGYIQVTTRVSNLRFHIVKLGFAKNDDMGMGCYIDERHFPSRIRVWVGPEIGSTYVASLTLGRSTENTEKEVKTQRTVKGNFGKMKIPSVKATMRQSTRTRTRNWRWDQDAQGNAAIFEAVLCEDNGGIEAATNKPPISEDKKSGNGLRKRYAGANRVFSKSGGLVFAKDEYGERVEWRLSKEMEGSVLKWRIGGRIWLSYWPNESKSSYFETRCVEWCDEVDLPLIPSSK